MKRIIAILVLLPAAAFAHPGHHSHIGFFANLRHVLTEPDHLAMLGGTVAVVALVVYLRKGQS